MNEDMPKQNTINKKKLVVVPKEPIPQSSNSTNSSNTSSVAPSSITAPSTPSASSSSSSSSSASTYDSSATVSSKTDESVCHDNLEKEFEKLNCSNENYYSTECNKFLLKKELVERNCLQSDETAFSYLYPNLNDKEFNIKISEKKEFYDTKYDGTIYEDVAKHADMLSKADYELQPHQAFVKNFMSFQTPYNSLLLYHGLGSGKTCSAIGVCEEMRDYMKQMAIHKRIIVVASENVQDNFKLQLFDERKLKLVDGLWNIQSCTGNKLLKEINPMSMKGIPKEKVVSQIKTIINTYYIFMGYGQFANYIIKTMNYQEDVTGKKNVPVSKKNEAVVLNKRSMQRLRNEFNNRFVVIDEIHNIRKSDDNENKKVAIYLELLVQSAQNMRFLFLSATPMYNNYKEIIWLLNLMNMNDRRGRIDVKDVFDKNGHLKKNGKEMLIRKATGYVSFVRGENPYTFPYRVYPNEFAKEHTFPFISYPSYQMNLKKIKPEDKNRILSLYLNTIGNCQECGECQGCIYRYIIHALRNKEFTVTTKKGEVREMPSFENMESFGYTMLQVPIESLIISYPDERLKTIVQDIPREKYSDVYSPSFSELEEEGDQVSIANATILSGGADDESPNSPLTRRNVFIDSNELTGRRGLERMMTYVDTKSPQEKGQFEYKKTTIEKYGRLFQRDIIGKYSAKIKCILEQIYNQETGVVSEGVVLIYSQYIDSGLIPMALALEEMGFTRYGQNAKPLFKQKPSEIVDVRTMKPRSSNSSESFIPARYSIITGDTRISPNNDYEVKGLTDEENKTGAKVKVVLISRAGSEGIDLKFIRQVHILDPWYNMNRIEQIIGRAVRNFSHKSLPFEKRNVEIYMYGTILGKENKEEAADLYVYRVAEYKAIQIGKVSRILKETAVDCIIHHDQTNFTQEKISEMLKNPIRQVLSNGVVLDDFKIGDAPFSPACDYMASCNYECVPNKTITENDLNEDTYNEAFIVNNSEKILQKIRLLMKESYFYKKDVLFLAIQTPKKYPYVQIYSALTQLIEDNNEFIVDKYGRNGRLVNIGEYYLFQPVELQDKNISIFDRMVPIDYKHESVQFEINKQMGKEKRKEQEREKEGETTEQYVEGKKVFEDLKKNMNIIIAFSKETKVPRGEDDWYKYCGIVMKKMKKEFPEITEEKMLKMLTSHMIELLLFDEKMDLMKYLYSLNNIEKNSFVWYLKDYFEGNSIVTKNFHAIVLYNLNKRVIMLLNGKNTWTEAQPEDEIEIASSKEAKQFFASLEQKNYNKIVGFIGYEKKNRFLVFKTKNMTSTRDTGARCDEAGKSKTLDLLNEIIGEPKYTNENTKLKKDSDGNVIQEPMNQIELCVLQEIILRYYDDIQKDGKSWFFTPEMAIYYKLYKILQ
jgi:hypothetical protein